MRNALPQAIQLCHELLGWLIPHLDRCAPGRAKRRRVVRGRHGADGRSRRPFSAVKPLWASVWHAARPQGGRGPGERRETRDSCAVTECERDLDVLSRITRAGAQSPFM